MPRGKIAQVEMPGRPILIGTVSIEKSERIANLLDKRGVKHEVLNAKQHKREAEIVAQAGREGAVTIATNMAGRGTDIVLGGNPETMAWAGLQDKYPTRLEVPAEEWEQLVQQIGRREKMKENGAKVKELGGLYIIGTERHESRRIDLQLRGRCGRQGDPGSSRFYLSLEDDLMRIFAGEWVKNVLTRFGMQEGEAIESKLVTRRLEGAQKKVEERNFEIRKNLLEYDEVMDEQRKRVYGYRQRILDGVNCRDLIMEMIANQIDDQLQRFLETEYGLESFATVAGNILGLELDPRDFRNATYEEAERLARDEAYRMADTQVFDAIEENLPEEEESEWNWSALAKWSNTRWNTNYRDRDLKKIGRDSLGEQLIVECERGHWQDRSVGLLPVSWTRISVSKRLVPGCMKSLASNWLPPRWRSWRRASLSNWHIEGCAKRTTNASRNIRFSPGSTGLPPMTAVDTSRDFNGKNWSNGRRIGLGSSFPSTTCDINSAKKSINCCWSSASTTMPGPTKWLRRHCNAWMPCLPKPGPK